MTRLRYDIRFIDCRSVLKDVLKHYDIFSEVLLELILFDRNIPAFLMLMMLFSG